MCKHEISEKKRLVSDVDIAIHQRLKAMAAWKNIAMQQYIAQAIVEKLIKDEEFIK